jgi:hypothetical protein
MQKKLKQAHGNWVEGDRFWDRESDTGLLLIDEVPLMVNRMLKGEDFRITPERKARVDGFMSWLRKNSLSHQEKIRIVLSQEQHR